MFSFQVIGSWSQVAEGAEGEVAIFMQCCFSFKINLANLSPSNLRILGKNGEWEILPTLMYLLANVKHELQGLNSCWSFLTMLSALLHKAHRCDAGYLPIGRRKKEKEGWFVFFSLFFTKNQGRRGLGKNRGKTDRYNFSHLALLLSPLALFVLRVHFHLQKFVLIIMAVNATLTLNYKADVGEDPSPSS